jgi:serine/threonine-protein kinase HipA
MAVGDKRRYVLGSIMPRHFFQTAASSSVAPAMVTSILDEIANEADRAIDAAIKELPAEFPEAIVSSIVDCMRRQIRLFAHAA